MKQSTLIFSLIILLSLRVDCQLIFVDTIAINDTTKIITKNDLTSLYTTTICGKDTIHEIEYDEFYISMMDSLRNADEYLIRDTISGSLEYFLLHDVHAIGDYGVGFSHRFFYYNPNILSDNKAFILFIEDHGTGIKVRYLKNSNILRMIDILNENMAFNLTDPGIRVHNIGGGYVDQDNISIIAVSDDKRLENTFVVYPSNIGFGNNILNYLWELRTSCLINNREIDLEEFLRDFENTLQSDIVLDDIINKYDIRLE